MDTDRTTLLLAAAAGLLLAGAALLLRRIRGGSLDRQPTLPNAPGAHVSEHTRRQALALAAAGNKIAAIKLLRDLAGLGLREAKGYVDALPTGPTSHPPGAPAPARELTGSELGDLLALVGTGNKIAAIKYYRELTGLGLKEAKDYVDALPTSGALAPRPGAPAPSEVARVVAPADLAEIRALAAAGNKIAAIKRLRDLTGMGLKEAKDYVDAL